MTSRRCGHTKCTKPPQLGALCVIHWLRNQKEYMLLPIDAHWWKRFEPGFREGLSIRLGLGEQAGPPTVLLPSTVRPHNRPKYEALILTLIHKADRAWRVDATSVCSKANR